MADLEERAPRPLYLIAGMLATKDPVGFFKPFSGLVRRVYTVPVPSSISVGRDPAELAAAAISAGNSSPSRPPVSPTPSNALPPTSRPWPPRILICGSLYLAGAVLAENGTPPR